MQTFSVALDQDGGFTIPSAFRDAIAFKPGDTVFVSLEEDGLHFRTELQASRREQTISTKREAEFS